MGVHHHTRPWNFLEKWWLESLCDTTPLHLAQAADPAQPPSATSSPHHCPTVQLHGLSSLMHHPSIPGPLGMLPCPPSSELFFPVGNLVRSPSPSRLEPQVVSTSSLSPCYLVPRAPEPHHALTSPSYHSRPHGLGWDP
jgi:hypothetical protein